MEYSVKFKKFIVIKRVEVPRCEYTYDNAVNKIIELNKLYNPSYIYCDAGSGEYQIETLHIYGDKHPETGLKNKVKRWQFKQSLDVIDPITYEQTKQPLKQFMVNQMQIGFDRERFILSPYDDIIFKQLIDYKVEKFGTNRMPIFTDKNEHYIDAMGLAYLAFVLEFKELVNVMKDIEVSAILTVIDKNFGTTTINKIFNSIENVYNTSRNNPYAHSFDPNEPRSEQQINISVPLHYNNRSSRSNNWGSRSGKGNYGGRSLW